MPAGIAPVQAYHKMPYKVPIQQTHSEALVCPIPLMRLRCTARSDCRLHRLAMEQDARAEGALLAKDVGPSELDARDRKPLHVAAEENWPDVAKALLKAGPDSQFPDRQSRTPTDSPHPGGRPAGMLDLQERSPDRKSPRPGSNC